MLPTVCRRIRKGTMLSGLLCWALIAVCPIQAQEKKAPPPVDTETLHLKAANPEKIAQNLYEILSESKTSGLRVTYDRTQNQVILHGSPEQMRAMRDLIDALGDKGLENPKNYINYYRSAQLLAAPKDNKAKVRDVLSAIDGDYLSAAAAAFAPDANRTIAAAAPRNALRDLAYM